MSIIIRDQLVGPPSWFASFRDLTLYCDIFLGEDVVVESLDPDPHWNWMRFRGGMDFVKDFVNPGTEHGIRIDFEPILPGTLVVSRIVPENVHRLIAQVRSHKESQFTRTRRLNELIEARLAS